ncbi:general substrate transporter [Setomelanomma holmii]|uniref:General substrate transporter n=1 Tax=Setomelanomma holmii TaxID=210430 RepID=A0A9P4GY81_9PLEO|nr:general substrate transporter [Setomelanomma holmii]
MNHSDKTHDEAAHPQALNATTDVNMTEAPVTWKAYLLCAFASFGGIFFGYDSGYINGVLNSPLFIEEVQGPICPQGLNTPNGACAISSSNTSLIVSILSAGTFFGALAAGDIADIYGRKWTIVMGCVIYMIGVVLQIAASGRDLLVAGRAIAGVGVGFESAIVILYMSEICPKKVRGALVSGYQFCITLGLLLAACVNYAVQGRGDTGEYRIPIGIQFAWGLILGIGVACLPDSPRYFIKRGRTVQAKKALMKVRGVHPTSPDAEHLRAMVDFELAEIIANEEYEREQTPAGGWLAGWANCFKGSLFQSNSNLRKTILGTSLQMMQQWTGVNFIFYYSTPFLQSTGAISNTFLISLIFTLVNVCSTPLSFYGMEKFGRRTLLLYGALGMLICQFLVAIIGVTVGFNNSTTLADGTTRANNLSAVNAQIAFIAIFIFFFATTWGPGAWVLIGEVFPLPIRSRGVALSTASNWLWNTIIAVITPYMVGTNEGNLRSSVFFIWGGLCTIAFVYTYFLVPETKGLSLEQVDQMMAETSPRTSAKWRPTHTFAEASVEKGGAARLEGGQVFMDTEKVKRTASIH